MNREYLKFNPPNLDPDLFLLSPTQNQVGEEISYLATDAARFLEHGDPFYPSRAKNRKLRFGAEFEVLFFSRAMDPGRANNRAEPHNPNYRDEHLNKVGNILRQGENFVDANYKLFYAPNPIEAVGRLMIEYRTAPLPLEGYRESVKQLRTHVIEQAKQYGVWAVVFSQHLHVSMVSTRSNVLKNAAWADGSYISRMNQIFLGALPLVQLPEDYDQFASVGMESYENIWHTEFRNLSSEYACDPELNTLLSLFAMYSALRDNEDPIFGFNVHYPDNYNDALLDLRDNKELTALFGRSLLSILVGTIKQYPAISRRDILIPDVLV